MMKSDVVPRTKTLFTWLPPYLIDRIKFDVGTATTRFEFGVAAIIRFKVSAYSVLIFFPITIVPPVVNWLPRPLRHVENIVAEHGHAFIETDGYAIHGGAHQCHSDNADNYSEGRERCRARAQPLFPRRVFHV